MLSGEGLFLVGNQAPIERVVEDGVEGAPGKWITTGLNTIFPYMALGYDPCNIKMLLQSLDRLQNQVLVENVSDCVGFLLVYDQFSVSYIVSKRYYSTHPHAPTL